MPKKPDESLTEYRDRVINAKSPSFCGAKWYNATTWLGSGTTTSCHHPPAHTKYRLKKLKQTLLLYTTQSTKRKCVSRCKLDNDLLNVSIVGKWKI